MGKKTFIKATMGADHIAKIEMFGTEIEVFYLIKEIIRKYCMATGKSETKATSDLLGWFSANEI